ncbi:hypothetical protein ANN_04928 [Periplaneta americana]|uniref:C2H2-type domain-containing protein n=1 Tax=Periplaneta americana TaxID=6978 RepID=A0ABQ8T9Q4_PERAM|nr:hypothetical protein ANN_04928 [Periplaneta americana]
MAGLCEGGNETPGSLKAINSECTTVSEDQNITPWQSKEESFSMMDIFNENLRMLWYQNMGFPFLPGFLMQPSIHDLEMNIENHLETSPLKCDVCDKTFKRHELMTHISQTGEKHFKCGPCAKKFTEQLNFLMGEAGGRSFPCEICNRTFPFRYLLIRHFRSHTGEKPFACTICDKGFGQRGALVEHVRVHTGEKPFQCEFCDKRFSRRDCLVDHLRTHSGEKPFPCDVCTMSFARRGDLMRHSTTHTGTRVFECEICNKRFARRSNLVCHSLIHTGEKPFECAVCGKSFARRRELASHCRIHTGEREFECEVCKKRFIRRHDVVIHMRLHTGEKPFKCKVCGRSFMQSNILSGHMRTHSTETPFKCEFCGKGFKRRGSLVDHTRTHTGDKPYKCELCDKSFNRQSVLWRHIQGHEGQKFRYTMERYTNHEQADKVFTYGQAHGNGRAAALLYQEKYPHRQHLQHTISARIFRRLGETGSFTGLGHHEGRVRKISTPALEEDVINAREQDCHISTRQMARQCGFTKGGIINLHNNPVWDMRNPHAMVEVNHQHWFSLNVWAGIIGDHHVGPVVLPRCLTGEAYLNFLRVTLPPLLEDVPCAVRMVMWLLHDGAPAHFHITLRRHLNNIFPDFYLWRHLKAVVYAEPIPDVQTLEQHIRAACDTIRMQPGIFEHVQQSLLQRYTHVLRPMGVTSNTSSPLLTVAS